MVCSGVGAETNPPSVCHPMNMGIYADCGFPARNATSGLRLRASFGRSVDRSKIDIEGILAPRCGKDGDAGLCARVYFGIGERGDDLRLIPR
jgi:hypothetical protein